LAAAAKVEVYQPSYSEKVEADNGAVFAIDLKTARHFPPAWKLAFTTRAQFVDVLVQCETAARNTVCIAAKQRTEGSSGIDVVSNAVEPK
jgi:hypothetical protein